MKKLSFKKWKIISIFLIFILSSLFHFIYDWFPSYFTSLIFPVNESIWEHNKLIFLSILIVTLIEKVYYKDNKNYLYSGLISSIVCSLLVMLIFTPIYLYILKTNDNIILTLIIYFISICISVYINSKLLKEDYNPTKEKIALIIWLLIFIVNAILTYYPPNIALFYDFNKNIYGR